MQVNKEYTYSLNTIPDLASELLPQLNHKVVLFNGEMGAGKTTLIKALLKEMRCNDVVTSPTFSIVNEYKIPDDKVYHFDFYRIEDIEDAYNFGIEDYLNSDHWLFIEWAERIEELIPDQHIIIEISIENPENRILKISQKT